MMFKRFVFFFKVKSSVKLILYAFNEYMFRKKARYLNLLADLNLQSFFLNVDGK